MQPTGPGYPIHGYPGGPVLPGVGRPQPQPYAAAAPLPTSSAPWASRRASRPGSRGASPAPAAGLARASSGHVRASSRQLPVPARPLQVGDVPSAMGLQGVPLDISGDGMPNATGFDSTGDGVVDALDTTGDGVIDTLVPRAAFSAPLHMCCGRGHELTAHAVDTDAWQCDECGARQALGALMHGCRICNFDRCDRCQNTRLGEKTPAARTSVGPYDDQLRAVYNHIDADRSGSISMLEFVDAVQKDTAIAELVAPGVDTARIMKDEEVFDSVQDAFTHIAGGQNRIRYDAFAKYFKAATSTPGNQEELRDIFDLIDTAKDGQVSKLELLGMVRKNPRVASYIVPGLNNKTLLDDQDTFDAVRAVFDTIARGKKRFSWEDFQAYFQEINAKPIGRKLVDRYAQRVLIIEIGFGRRVNPMQSELVKQAGYQIMWARGLPNPEQAGFPVSAYVPQLKSMLEEFKPHLVIGASKGAGYLPALWFQGEWTGPSLMINCHPSVKVIPKGVTVVLCHGSNDEVYHYERHQLETLMRTGSKNRYLLYYTANSGPLPTGQRTREGDTHNQASLLSHDTLPRLMDAALSKECPEMYLIRSWRERLSTKRLEAELQLGYEPGQLHKYWVSQGKKGRDKKKLFDVACDSDEYKFVSTVFKAAPTEKAAYCGENHAAWERRPILKIERVENGAQDDGSVRPYFESLQKAIQDQALTFEPGVHTRWAFHGTDAIDSIVNSPMSGFQPLASGTKGASLWGSGTYFARDAKYVAEGGFCKKSPDGTYRMLMCLLAIGVPCLGDPEHKGVMPLRQDPHRYNSSVDLLSNPEIFILQHSGAAYPGYVISFA